MDSFRYLFQRLLTGLLLSVLVVGAWKHTAIIDWFKLYNYRPPTAISSLAAADTMTVGAQHIYYINHPQLVASAASFSRDCPQLEQTIVLGCYQSGESGVFLRDVSDPRLSGVEEVTAAHEMLHGAYERLSSKDRSYIDGLLMDYYDHDLHDQRIIDTMSAYKKSEPNDVVNEMHSVFGTEISSLPQPLENYYKRYFTNRATVTNFANGYEGEFTSRLDKIKADEAQLNSLKQLIDSQEAFLNNQSSQIQADRASLDSLRNSGQTDQYNSRAAAFNQEVDAYNAQVARLKSQIDSYNSIVEAHNQLAEELRGLYESLGTSLSAQPAQ